MRVEGLVSISCCIGIVEVFKDTDGIDDAKSSCTEACVRMFLLEAALEGREHLLLRGRLPAVWSSLTCLREVADVLHRSMGKSVKVLQSSLRLSNLSREQR